MTPQRCHTCWNLLDYCTCAPARTQGYEPQMFLIPMSKATPASKPGEYPTPVTYEQAVADAQWRIHMHFQQQMIHGPDGIPYDFDPVAAAEELLR